MDELNGEYHEDFFSPLNTSETEHEYMKEFLLEPSKPSRNLYGNNVMQQQQQQLPQGMLYPSNSGMCSVANTNSFATSNCFESNGRLDGNMPMPMHDPGNVGSPLVTPHYMSGVQTHIMPGMQMSNNMGIGSSGRMGMSNSGLGLNSGGLGMPVPSQVNLLGMGGSSSGPSRNPYTAQQNQFPGNASNMMGIHPANSSGNMGMHPTQTGNMSMHNPSSGMGLHNASSGNLGMHSSASPSGIGMHSTASNNMGLHSTASPSGMGMHSTASPSGMGMHSSASPSGMGMHSSASPSGMGMHSSASPSGMGMHSSASPSGMGMHSSASPSGMGMHSSASPSGMGMHSSASPSGMGMHSSASPSGMGMHSNPSPAMHSSASPSGMGMHSSASPAGMGLHAAPSPSPLGMPSPAPSLGKPSASPNRAALSVASPSVLNMPTASARSPMTVGASRSPYRSSPSQFSGASPANIPSASPGRLSMPSASPGQLNMMSSSPLGQEVNGATNSASCSESSSPAALERLAAERLPSGVTVSVTERIEVSAQPRRTPPPQDVLTITPVNEYAKPGTSGFGKKKDITQVKKVRRKYNTDGNAAKAKKRKDVRSQVVLSDPRGEPGFGAPSLYNLLTQESPLEGSLLSVGELGGPSTAGGDFSTASGTVKRGRKRKSGDGGSQRAPPKQRTTVTYHSQISSQNGIKLKIKKSEPVKKPSKPRVRKKKNRDLDSDSDEAVHHRRTNHHKAVVESDNEEKEQSGWGCDRLPKKALHRIFQIATYEEGCVPFLVRMQRVCGWWREVALTPDLWHTIELCSTWVRDRAKNIHSFRWLCENRLTSVRDLNLGGWKFSGIPSLLDVIANNCTELRGLNLAGWQGLHIEHVLFLVTNCQNLERIDLSGVNPEAHNNKGAVSLNSMQNLTSVMGQRLTHLVLANNKLAGVPQIVQAIGAACPNLQVLDMSNVRTVAHATAMIHIEKLQEGCQKLRVLRITNSQFALCPVTIKEQVESPGFPNLEELSVASPNGRMDTVSTSTPYIDDESLGRILKASNKLRLLDVRGCCRISDSSLVRIPAWDLEHLYLSGCYVTRVPGSGLELITQKWGHSLIELDLAWSSSTEALDLAVQALAEVTEKGCESPLRILNLCGSSVNLEPVKSVLLKCLNLLSLNLASCRALPRGMKRTYEGVELIELRSQYQEKPPEPSPEPESVPDPVQNVRKVEDYEEEVEKIRYPKKHYHDEYLEEEEPEEDEEAEDEIEEEEEEAKTEPETEPDEDELDALDSKSEPDLDGSNSLSELEAQDETDDFFEQGNRGVLDIDIEDTKPKLELLDESELDLDPKFAQEPHQELKLEMESGSESDTDIQPKHQLEYGLSENGLADRDPLNPFSEVPYPGACSTDDEVMTPEDLQMVAKAAQALANTPEGDALAAEAMSEAANAGLTPNTGGSTPAAASSTPHSGTYSEAGTPGPSGTFSEAGTPGQSGTCSEAGTPGPSGTFSDAGTPGPSGTESGTPGTPGTGTTSGTTPQQGTEGDGELLALAQDVKYSLENHLNFSFSELDCGSLP